MISAAMTMTILTHPYQVMLAVVVLFHGVRRLFAVEEGKAEVAPRELSEAA